MIVGDHVVQRVLLDDEREVRECAAALLEALGWTTYKDEGRHEE